MGLNVLEERERECHMHGLIDEDGKDVIQCKMNIHFVFLRMKQVVATGVNL